MNISVSKSMYNEISHRPLREKKYILLFHTVFTTPALILFGRSIWKFLKTIFIILENTWLKDTVLSNIHATVEIDMTVASFHFFIYRCSDFLNVFHSKCSFLKITESGIRIPILSNLLRAFFKISKFTLRYTRIFKCGGLFGRSILHIICEPFQKMEVIVLVFGWLTAVRVRLTHYQESRTVGFILQQFKQTSVRRNTKRNRPFFDFTLSRMDDHCKYSIFDIPINLYCSGLQYISRVNMKNHYFTILLTCHTDALLRSDYTTDQI